MKVFFTAAALAAFATAASAGTPPPPPPASGPVYEVVVCACASSTTEATRARAETRLASMDLRLESELDDSMAYDSGLRIAGLMGSPDEDGDLVLRAGQ
ncbi:MAG: hypothetical protein K2Q06_11995 [Parvularculaceae bacterium]|nr:hypothetical protein [Parvularculaceae bacterium]